MIQKPEEMDFSKKSFTLIIAGSPGLGKTTLALSAPDPLLLDLDNGISRVKAEHRGITAMIETYDELLKDMKSTAYEAAKSIIIDTGGSLVQMMQPWAQKQEPKAARDGRAMFGVVKREFSRLCYQIKNQDGKNLIVVFHTTEVQKGDVTTMRLSCEGSAKDIVWTPADFGGCMYMLGRERMIGFRPTEEYFAKGCYGINNIRKVPDLALGEKNTYLTDLFEEARENITKEMSIYAPVKAAYEKAIENGKAIIALIEKPEDVFPAGNEIKGLEHSLTSEDELLAMLKTRIDQIGAVWNKEKKQYEQGEGDSKSA